MASSFHLYLNWKFVLCAVISCDMCVWISIGWLRSAWWPKAKQQNKKRTKKHWQEKWYIWRWVVVFEQQIWSSLREHFRKKNIYTKVAHWFIVSEGFLHAFVCCQNYNLWLDAFRSCFWINLVFGLALLLRIYLKFFSYMVHVQILNYQL